MCSFSQSSFCLQPFTTPSPSSERLHHSLLPLLAPSVLIHPLLLGCCSANDHFPPQRQQNKPREHVHVCGAADLVHSWPGTFQAKPHPGGVSCSAGARECVSVCVSVCYGGHGLAFRGRSGSGHLTQAPTSAVKRPKWIKKRLQDQKPEDSVC